MARKCWLLIPFTLLFFHTQIPRDFPCCMVGVLVTHLWTALDTPKQEQMRIQGVIYGLGAVFLLIAHTGSGVMRAETVPLSAAMVLPALVGMWIGGRLQDRIDQRAFRRATLAVLLIAGLNLVRRGWIML